MFGFGTEARTLVPCGCLISSGGEGEHGLTLSPCECVFGDYWFLCSAWRLLDPVFPFGDYWFLKVVVETTVC